MKTILLLALLTLAVVSLEAKKIPPTLPDRYLALGNFWVIDRHSDVLSNYGHFNKKYDWTNGISRIDSFIAPESETDANFMTIWQSKDNTVVSVLDDQDLSVNCTEMEHWGKLMPPDYLTKICKFHSLDSANGHLANKWVCEGEHKSHIMAWTNAITDAPLKITMHFKKVKVILDYSSFLEMDEFDSDLFVPPKAWNCPAL